MPCVRRIYEKPEDIVTFAPLGRGESEWITEIAPTALAASGCQIVLFTTGRGTPFSTFVPTFKISTNNRLAEHKQNWIDFNAYSMDDAGLYAAIMRCANGETKAKSEDVREIAFYKTGVTL